MSCYIHNIISVKVNTYATPVEVLYRKQPSYTHLRIFGCLCYPNLLSTTSHKLQPLSIPCVFLKFPINHRGYKFFDPSSKNVIISRHVTFDESSFPFSQLTNFTNSRYNFLDAEPSPLISHIIAQELETQLPSIGHHTPSFSPNNGNSE